MTDELIALPRTTLVALEEQATPAAMVDVLAFAQGFALVARALGGEIDPLTLTRRLLKQTVYGQRWWDCAVCTLVEYLQREVECEALRAVPARSGARLVPQQLGALHGIRAATRDFGLALVMEHRFDGSLTTLGNYLIDAVREYLSEARALHPPSAPRGNVTRARSAREDAAPERVRADETTEPIDTASDHAAGEIEVIDASSSGVAPPDVPN